MIIKTYDCDGGALAIGTVDARATFPNCFGDGRHTVFIHDCGEKVPSNAVFRGAVEGQNIKVFKYDCYSDEDCEEDTSVIAELSGRFGVYAIENCGDMILQRWK